MNWQLNINQAPSWSLATRRKVICLTSRWRMQCKPAVRRTKGRPRISETQLTSCPGDDSKSLQSTATVTGDCSRCAGQRDSLPKEKQTHHGHAIQWQHTIHPQDYSLCHDGSLHAPIAAAPFLRDRPFGRERFSSSARRLSGLAFRRYIRQRRSIPFGLRQW